MIKSLPRPPGSNTTEKKRPKNKNPQAKGNLAMNTKAPQTARQNQAKHPKQKAILVLTLACTLTLTLAVHQAHASTLFGTTGDGNTGPSTLYVIDPATGAMSPIGPVGYIVNGMDWFNGKLYANTSTEDPTYFGLIEINPKTGAGTPIGAGWPGTMTAIIVEMAIDSNGKVYAWGEGSEDDLYRINITTGTATHVGDAGISTMQHGLAFDLDNNLYFINWNGQTYDINTSTGASTSLGTIGVQAHHGDVDPDTGIYVGLSDKNLPDSDLVFVNLDTLTVIKNVPTDEKLHTLAFKPSPRYTLLGTLGQGGIPSMLVTINPNTGALDPIGPVGFAVNGMDWYNGKLYATTSTKDPSYHGLIEIDPRTGQGDPIGSGWPASMTTTTIAEMAIDSLGHAFGWGEPSEDDLYAINLNTGNPTSVGDAGLGTQEFGLAFALTDDLYLINVGGNVYDINPASGASTLLGNIGVSHARHADVKPDTGVYYGLSDNNQSFSDLLTVNLNTLTVLDTVRTDEEVHTLAWVPTLALQTWTDNFGNVATVAPYNLRDISASGTEILAGTDDSTSDPIPIPFDFNFYGQEVSHVRVGSNGIMTLDHYDGSGSWTGPHLPTPDSYNGLVAGFWLDLRPASGGTVRHQVLGSPPNQQFVVGFYDIHNYGGVERPTVTFEMILHERSCNIELQYASAYSDGTRATVGIENFAGTDAIQLFNEERLVLTEQAFLITHPCPFRLLGDLNSDCTYNLIDFGMAAQNWLVDCINNPANPACVPY